jgi:hypothetical protein
MKGRLDELGRKYFDLAHLARACPATEAQHPDIKATNDAIRNRYPAETALLEDPDSADFYHGVYSGILAAVRLVQVYATSRSANRIRQAEEEFPFMDT